MKNTRNEFMVSTAAFAVLVWQGAFAAPARAQRNYLDDAEGDYRIVCKDRASGLTATRRIGKCE